MSSDLFSLQSGLAKLSPGLESGMDSRLEGTMDESRFMSPTGTLLQGSRGGTLPSRITLGTLGSQSKASIAKVEMLFMTQPFQNITTDQIVGALRAAILNTDLESLRFTLRYCDKYVSAVSQLDCDDDPIEQQSREQDLWHKIFGLPNKHYDLSVMETVALCEFSAYNEILDIILDFLSARHISEPVTSTTLTLSAVFGRKESSRLFCRWVSNQPAEWLPYLLAPCPASGITPTVIMAYRCSHALKPVLDKLWLLLPTAMRDKTKFPVLMSYMCPHRWDCQFATINPETKSQCASCTLLLVQARESGDDNNRGTCPSRRHDPQATKPAPELQLIDPMSATHTIFRKKNKAAAESPGDPRRSASVAAGSFTQQSLRNGSVDSDASAPHMTSLLEEAIPTSHNAKSLQHACVTLLDSVVSSDNSDLLKHPLLKWFLELQWTAYGRYVALSRSSFWFVTALLWCLFVYLRGDMLNAELDIYKQVATFLYLFTLLFCVFWDAKTQIDHLMYLWDPRQQYWLSFLRNRSILSKYTQYQKLCRFLDVTTKRTLDAEVACFTAYTYKLDNLAKLFDMIYDVRLRLRSCLLYASNPFNWIDVMRIGVCGATIIITIYCQALHFMSSTPGKGRSVEGNAKIEEYLEHTKKLTTFAVLFVGMSFLKSLRRFPFLQLGRFMCTLGVLIHDIVKFAAITVFALLFFAGPFWAISGDLVPKEIYQATLSFDEGDGYSAAKENATGRSTGTTIYYQMEYLFTTLYISGIEGGFSDISDMERRWGRLGAELMALIWNCLFSLIVLNVVIAMMNDSYQRGDGEGWHLLEKAKCCLVPRDLSGLSIYSVLSRWTPLPDPTRDCLACKLQHVGQSISLRFGDDSTELDELATMLKDIQREICELRQDIFTGVTGVPIFDGKSAKSGANVAGNTDVFNTATKKPATPPPSMSPKYESQTSSISQPSPPKLVDPLTPKSASSTSSHRTITSPQSINLPPPRSPSVSPQQSSSSIRAPIFDPKQEDDFDEFDDDDEISKLM